MHTSTDVKSEVLSKIKSTFPQGNLIPDYVDYPGQLRESWVQGPVNILFQHLLSEIEMMPEIANVELLLPTRADIDSEEYFSFMSARITIEDSKWYANLQLSYVGVCGTLLWYSEKQERLTEPPTERWEQILQQIAETSMKQGINFIFSNDPFFEEVLVDFRMGVQKTQITVYNALFFFEYC